MKTPVKILLFAAAILTLNFEIASQAVDSQFSFEIEQQAARLRANDVETRRDAVHKLLIIQNAAAARAALPALSDKAEIVRATAAEAAALLADEDAAAALIPLLAKDNSELVRREAAFALGQANSKTAVPALITALTTDKRASVRAAAAIALGNIQDARAVFALAQILTAPAAKKNRRTIDEFVRRSAARALGQIGHNAAVGSLIETLRSQTNSDDVRREAARALGAIANEPAVAVLTENLKASDYLLAQIAADALKRIELKRSERLQTSVQK